jgi:hypothetical protein
MHIKVYGKLVILLLLLYFYLFNPLFFALNVVGSVKFVLLLGFIGLLFKKKALFFLKQFKSDLLLFLILLVYTYLVTFLGKGAAKDLPYMQFIWFLESYITSVFFYAYFSKIFQKFSIEKIIIWIGFIASLITVYLITHPATNLYVRNSVIMDSLDLLETPEFYRGFSIAESSSYIYGILLGIIASLSLLVIRKNMLYLFIIIFLLVAIMFNARTGLFIFAFSLLLSLMRGEFNYKVVFYFISLVVIINIVFFSSSFYANNEESFKWIFGAFNSTKSIDLYDENSNYSFLYQMIFLPDTVMGFLWGNGKMPMNSSGGSDIGYIRHIYVGGILLLLIELSFLFYLFKRSIANSTSKSIDYIFLSAILIANFKGDAFFVPSGFFRLFVLYYVINVLRKSDKVTLPTDFSNKQGVENG